ncbi:hypothetical protein F3Y22_tig00110944pilonHSYRG00016 [Hibiscus syriacus]|uniref:Uncharacterized protein n=1 Tax=Hibiscus syriacus TaxID=106335 RepID=A0A6A2ZBU5_HIBSY|nr:hypothetical protein F3Y22_tig00110944pilonHSYRG00016 [Hibiscus syriacus]
MDSEVGDQSQTLAVVKPMARGASFPIQYPTLSETNYGIWAVKMKIILRSLGVWSVIEDGDTDDDKDQGAMVAISQAVPDDVMMAIAEKQTAKEAWDALREMRVGEDRVKKARVQVLKRQLNKLYMEDSETINEFSMKLTTLVGEIRSLGTKLDDSEVIEKLFNAVPDKFLQIIGTIEQFGDIEMMSVSEAIGRLRTFEEGLKGRMHSKSSGEQLLLTQAEWEARIPKAKRDEGSCSNKRGGRHGRGRGRGRGNGGGRGNGERKNEDQKPRNFDKSKVKCFNCNEYGHFAKECPKPNRREKANLVTKQIDDEPTLLMIETCVLSHAIQNEHVLLHEDKVVPKMNSTQDKAWYLDTGVSNHMPGCIRKFAEIDTTIKRSVKFGDGSAVEIQGRGSILFKCFIGEHRVLTNVYYIPKLKSNIISLGQLEENGCKVVIEGGVMSIYDISQRVLEKVNRSRSRLYVFNIVPALPECLLARSKEDAWHWYARYGHVNFHALKLLSQKQMVRGLPIIEHEDRICDGCLIGKQHRNPFPAVVKFRAESPLELWHGDLCGPITPATHGGKTFEAFKKIKASAEMEKNIKLKAFRIDRGGEFTSNEFKTYYELLGIKRYLTAPYSPQQNGVVERRNQTVVGMARSLLKRMGVSGEFWGEAPTVDHFRIFGCVGHVKDVTPHLSKLTDRSKPMVFIGYDSNTKGYRMFDPKSKRVVVTRDVVFEEEKKWEWSKFPETKSAENTLTTHYFTIAGTSDTTNQKDKEGVSDSGIGIGMDFPQPTQEQTGDRYQYATPVMNTRSRTFVSNSPYTPTATVEESVSTETLQPLTSDESSSVGPRGKRGIKSLYDVTVPIELQYSGLCLLGEEEPSNFEEAKADPMWRRAMEEEISSIRKNETWKLVPLPDSHKPIGLKWVYKLKNDTQGRIVKHKARLMAKGYVQRQGIDFDEVFAPVARLETVCLLISIAAHEGWEVHHMDVKSAFLNALYGLRQAPRAWNSKLDKSLSTLGFDMCSLEHVVYMRNQVCQNSQRMTLNQSAYARKVLDKCGIKDCNHSKIPMEPRLKLSKESTSPPVDTTLYRSIVGSLRYLLHTRPDLAFSVGMVSRYMEKPTTEHMAVVKHILRYVKGTLNLGCVYEKKEGSLELIGYSDSDLAGDTNDRKSTSCLIFFLGSVSKSVAGRLLADLLKTEVKKVILKIDNQSAIALSKNSVHQERSKHIDTRFHYIRDCVE